MHRAFMSIVLRCPSFYLPYKLRRSWNLKIYWLFILCYFVLIVVVCSFLQSPQIPKKSRRCGGTHVPSFYNVPGTYVHPFFTAIPFCHSRRCQAVRLDKSKSGFMTYLTTFWDQQRINGLAWAQIDPAQSKSVCPLIFCTSALGHQNFLTGISTSLRRRNQGINGGS